MSANSGNSMEEVDKESKYSRSPYSFLDSVLTIDTKKSLGDETIRKISSMQSHDSPSLLLSTNIFQLNARARFVAESFLTPV